MTDCHSGGTVCSPSRAALPTGRNPYRSGFFYLHSRNTYLKDEEITLAEVLKEQGYETAFRGKWHLSMRKDNFTLIVWLPKRAPSACRQLRHIQSFRSHIPSPWEFRL